MSKIVRNKKDIIYLMNKYNKSKIEIVYKVDIGLVGSDIAVCSNRDNIYYSVLKDDILIIEDTITKDNIHLYYEFMSNEDIKKYSSILHDIFTDRRSKISCIID